MARPMSTFLVRPQLLLLAALGNLLLAAPAFSAAAVWQDRVPEPTSDAATSSAPLHAYRALTLDLPALRRQLDDAPDEHGTATPLRLLLPMPDGTVQQFDVWRTQVMAAGLAARYPHIRSFTARAVDHPETQARLDDSPHGFSAMVRAPDGVTLLQPVTRGEGTRYVSFNRAALGASADLFKCLLDTAGATQLRAPSAVPQTITGANVRNYRLAIAATGEYTATFGGTVADGMAAIVQAINRVNGIYLTEFAVQFQIVNNNDQLVYTNASTDPYTNNNPNFLLSQNQSNIDTVIGSSNYDFGHVFSTAGGGLAAVGVACSASSKAQGETGSSNPTGDGFWVDYVAHEMGHQMGALHSFNSTDGACSGNRDDTQATEPGSGSTIMAYAGICAPSDLQPHSDPFFHAISLVPIQARLTGSGGGTTCGTVLTTTNHAPVPAPVAAHNVPSGTPFALTGAATDQDGDALTYIWEEMDLGTQSPPEGDDGSRPLFRSFVPTSSPTRLFPELPRILAHDLSVGVPAGGEIPGESYPTTTRDMSFRLTVRDNHPGGGASASTDTVVHVTSEAGPFAVTAPLTGAQWIANTAQTVSWNVANTTAAPVSCPSVDVYYSADGGNTFPALLAGRVPNSGSASVISPNLGTDTARIEVFCHGNIFFDISPGNFSIITDDIFKDGFDG
jgi:hypothetical protein